MTFSKTSSISSHRGWSFRQDCIWQICILASFLIFAICVLPVANQPIKDETSDSEQSTEQVPAVDEHIALESGLENEEEPVENVREKRQLFDFNFNDQLDLSNLASLYKIDAQFFDGEQSLNIPVPFDFGNMDIQLETLPDVSDILGDLHFTMGDNFGLGNLAQTFSFGNIPGETIDSGTFRIETGVDSPVSIHIGEISDGVSVTGDEIMIGNIGINMPGLESHLDQVKFDGSDIKMVTGDNSHQVVYLCQGPDCQSNGEFVINVNSVVLRQPLSGDIDICQLSSLGSSNVQIHVPDASDLAYTVPLAISISDGQYGTINLSEQDCTLLAKHHSAEQTANGYNDHVGGAVTCSIILPSIDIRGCPTGSTKLSSTITTTSPPPTTTSPPYTTTTPLSLTTSPPPTTTSPPSTTTTPLSSTTSPPPTTTSPPSTTTTPLSSTTSPPPTTTSPPSTTTTPLSSTTSPPPTTTSPPSTTTTPLSSTASSSPTTTSLPPTTPTTTVMPETLTMLSRTLRYRDPSAEPCEDFYQYACGGFEADPVLKETDLEEEANKRILAESKTTKNSPEAAQFTAYYESCLKYDERVPKSERMRLAVQAVGEVGKLFTDETWWKKDYDLTDLLIKLIQHDSPILFDLSVDVDHQDPGKYIITLEPPSSSSPLFVRNEENECRVFENDREYTGQINLGELHANYTKCKQHKSAAAHTIAPATRELLSSGSNDVVELMQLVQQFQNDADELLLDNFLLTYPSEDEARYHRTSKKLDVVSVRDLENEIGDIEIDWQRLLSTVTKTEVTKNTKLQAYSFSKLVAGFEVFNYASPMSINNALIVLYIRNIYHELIVPRPANVEKYCMDVAKNLMKVQTSSLYLSSYSDEDLTKINEQVSIVFEALRETLRLDVENVAERAAWFNSEVRERLLKKIKEFTLVQPIPSAYANNQADLDVSLSDNFFENTMKLRKNDRTSLYDRLTKNRNDPKEIWNHFALPYQTEALPIYGTNQIVVPYGWIGQSDLLEHDVSPMDYSVLATLGHIISRQIAHQFDDSSIKFNRKNGLYDKDIPAENSRQNNAECYKKNIEVPRSIMLPLTDQKIRFEITYKSADERFADAVALNLTYNTMLRLSPEFGVGHEDDVKQFFLDYAQMHCTKIPLTKSGTSTLAFQYLPSRIRLMLVAEHSHPFRKAFACPLRPEPICDVFPYIKPVKPFRRILEAAQLL